MSVLEQNKQIVRDYFKAFLAADEGWWRDHIAPTFRRHDPGLPKDQGWPRRHPQGHKLRHLRVGSTPVQLLPKLTTL